MVTQVCSLNLRTMQVKVLQEKITGTDMGKTFAYLATGYSGEVYTFYRERSPAGVPLSGYLEINYFSAVSLILTEIQKRSFPKDMILES